MITCTLVLNRNIDDGKKKYSNTRKESESKHDVIRRCLECKDSEKIFKAIRRVEIIPPLNLKAIHLKKNAKEGMNERKDRSPSSSTSPDTEIEITHRVPNKQGNTTMKPEKYDGTTSIDGFFSRFDACSRYYDRDEEEKLTHLCYCMTGEMAIAL